MTKDEMAIAATAIIFGVLLDRALKDFDPKLFVATASEQNDIPDDAFERAMASVAEFVRGVKPVWLDFKL
jgi:hypothetical protein